MSAARKAERQTLLESKLANLKEYYLDSDNPTGEPWTGFRADVMASWRRPSKTDAEIPLLNIIEDYNPIVLHKVPKTCSPLDNPASSKKWPLETVQLGPSQRKDLASFDEFKQQLELATHGFLKYVPWKETHSFVAGGLIEACLRSPEGTTPEANVREGPRKDGDVDIFFYGKKNYNDLTKSSTTVALSIIKAMKEAGVDNIKMERRTS